VSGGPTPLATALEGARVVVVCGSGGVGKTSISAALALSSARAGASTAVLAVDPARRLATSLGLPRDPGDRRRIDAGAGTSLDALLLDTKRTFDTLVERHAGSAERRDRILANRFYQRISDTLSGTHEYMAMERLHELATEERHERLVIDTPPTRSALAFLDAPKRLGDFLGGRTIRWLLWPYRRAGSAGLRGASLGAQALARTLGKVAGAELLADTAEFLAAFDGMYDGFKRRAEATLRLLAQPSTAFVVVAAPDEPSLAEAGRFVDRLGSGGMHLAGVVVNRSRHAPPLPGGAAALGPAVTRLDEGQAEDRAVAGLVALAERLETVEAGARLALDRFRAHHPGVGVTIVPEMADDVHDVDALVELGASLLG
jgi:anion-transporting  ArsA/GET3 family ATPase